MGRRPDSIRRNLLLAPVLLAACSYRWGTEAPAVTLTGSPPALSSMRKLNRTPAGVVWMMTGADGDPWAAFCELGPSPTPAAASSCPRLRLVRLAPARPGVPDEEVLEADMFAVRTHVVYLLQDDVASGQRSIRLHRPGDLADAAPFVVPLGTTPPLGQKILYTSDGLNDVFVYWVLDPATTTFGIYRRDGRYQRQLPVPEYVDPLDPGGSMDFVLTADGSKLVVLDPTSHMTAYSTLDEGRRSLGARPPRFYVDDARNAVLCIGNDFRSVPLDGGPDVVLSDTFFDADTLRVDSHGNAWYLAGSDLYRVPLAGGSPPELVQPQAARLLALGPQGEVVYSRDPEDRFIGGAGDGWIGDWRFMERGRYPTYSRKGTRLHFLEQAATTSGVGLLRSVATPGTPEWGSPPLTLALNVNGWAELADGRLLVDENHAVTGAWNRLVVIDEASRTARWVAPGVADFRLVPGGRDVLLEVVSGVSGYDIYQTAIP